MDAERRPGFSGNAFLREAGALQEAIEEINPQPLKGGVIRDCKELK